MVEDKKSVDPTLVGFYEAMERTNVEKITDEMLAGLPGDSSHGVLMLRVTTKMPKISHEGKSCCFWKIHY